MYKWINGKMWFGISHQKICLEYIKIFQIFAGNVNNMKGLFTMFGVYAKSFKNWIQIHTLIQTILKVKVQLKPDIFLLGLLKTFCMKQKKMHS